MKMKISMVIIAALLLVSCTPATASSTGASSASIAESEIIQNAVPAFQGVHNNDLPVLDMGYDDELLEFDYESTVPDKSFLDAWVKLDTNSMKNLLDMKNFFPVGEYTLFYYNLPANGPSKICIDFPDGSTQQIFTCTMPIWELNISPTGKSIVISIITPMAACDVIGDFYEFNLENGEVRNISGIGDLATNLSGGDFYYGNYYIPIMEDTDEGISNIGSLKRQAMGSDDYTVIVERFDGSYLFANGFVYYQKPNDPGIYYRALEGDLYQQESKLPDTIKRYTFINGDFVFAEYGIDSPYTTMMNIATGKVVAELKTRSINNASMFDLNGFYFVDEDYVLQHSDFDGKLTPVLMEMEDIYVEAVREGWVYFEYEVPNNPQQYSILGKVGLNGTGVYFFT